MMVACGLSQLYAMRYGALPLVRLTGGLRDTVTPWDPVARRGTGFCFTEASAAALEGALNEALSVWRADPERWRQMRDDAMARDSSWGLAADTYLEVYRGEHVPWAPARGDGMDGAPARA